MYPPLPRPVAPSQPHPGARAASLLFGLSAIVSVGAVILLRTGSEVAAIAGGLVAASLMVVGVATASATASRLIATLLFLTVVVSAGWLAVQALTLYRAFTSTAGPADPADPVALAAAEAEIAAFDASGSFRIELTEGEIEAVIQEGLSSAESPLARVAVDIVDGDPDGELRFVGEFKEGGIAVSGAVGARLASGAVQVELMDLDLGSLTVPGLAAGAIEDLVESIADLNQILTENRADVQSILLRDDRLVVTGTQGGGEMLTSSALLTDLQEQAAAVSASVQPPPERLGPGEVNAVSAPGDRYYVALGDSLAANVGVDQARLGYVSRVHRALEAHDGTDYGLRNFAVPGETTGTLIRDGQLDAAISFMSGAEVDYVTIDIGANDLLGHLGSADCSASLEAEECSDRIAATFATYEENIGVIFARLRSATPDAEIVFLRAYNPFSLGFGATIEFEAQSDAILDAYNDVAAGLAAEHGIVVADGFTPMQGTTAATTHMLDAPPDIHPVSEGYDLLAVAVVTALGMM